ncbi:uncharacterized protein IL334_005690 [Kwoniella shivajii]|uniref:NADH dehydrogenase [ubiquinone] 1 alpha subcomplex subunit n=1 Tax=Kwoniella shivajii TaxID=564305 RepID=A0ABZ1D3V0_9TREE|nr:hypothetical protein IL334_005690 [Kwoniella shivajii]
MSGLFGTVRKFFRPKGLIGYDLQGNKYFEIPNPAGGRMKRFVQYKKNRDLAEYSRSELKPPVQWRAWLSHTRVEPPSLEELEFDFSRQQELGPKIIAIEAREREERIRQGYLLPDGSNPNEIKPSQIAGPSTTSERKARIAQIGQSNHLQPNQSHSHSQSSSQMQGQSQASSRNQPHPINALNSENNTSTQSEYPIPTPTHNQILPPSITVDPIQHSSAEDLRKLAMEDTRKRIAESEAKSEPEKKDRGVHGVGLGLAEGGLQPRRRGKQ